MRSFFLIVLLVISSNLKCLCQNNKDGNLLKYIEGPKIEYSIEKDSSQKIFYTANQSRIHKIQDSLETFPIDRCHHGLIIFHLFIDSAGNLQKAELLKGSSIAKLDTKILSAVESLPGKWIMTISENTFKPFDGNISYLLMNTFEKRKTTKSVENVWQGNTLGKQRTITMSKELDVKKNCEDNDFYYGAGVKEFGNKNFKSALNNFKKANEANPYDLDVIYNIAISYFKMNDIENACNFFKMGMEYGDLTAEKKI